MVNHIESLGYKNIIILADKKTFRENVIVLKDVLSAMETKKEINKPVIIEVDRPVAGNEIDSSKFDQYLRPPYRADAIVVINADLVYPLMSLMRKKKLRIPQDIAILSMEEGTGFDLMFSPVTCLRKPLSGLSIKVVNMIWSEVKNSGKGKYKRQVNLSPELIVRNSCGTI